MPQPRSRQISLLYQSILLYQQERYFLAMTRPLKLSTCLFK